MARKFYGQKLVCSQPPDKPIVACCVSFDYSLTVLKSGLKGNDIVVVVNSGGGCPVVFPCQALAFKGAS